MQLCMNYNELIQKLEQLGFRLGFSTLNQDPTFKRQVDFWYKGNAVLLLKYTGVVVKSVDYVNESLSGSCITYPSVIRLLQFICTHAPNKAPEIEKTFKGTVFCSGDDSVTKYNMMLTVFPKFADDFQALFAAEMQILAEDNSVMQIRPDMSKIYVNSEGRHFYISSFSEECIHLISTDILMRNVILNYHEFADYSVDEASTLELKHLLYAFIQCFQEILGDYEPIINEAENNEDFIIFKKPSIGLGVSFIIPGKILCLDVHSDFNADISFDETPDAEALQELIESSKEELKQVLVEAMCDENTINFRIAHEMLESIILHFPTVLVSDEKLNKWLFELVRQIDQDDFSVSRYRDPRSTEKMFLSDTTTSETDFASLALGESSAHHILPGDKSVPAKMKF